MKIAVLLVSRNRPDLVERQIDWLRRNVRVDHDVFLVEAGTDADKLSPHATVHYADDEFRGKCFAHNIALQHANQRGEYDYYWVLMNDVVFEEGVDAARILLETLEANPRMAILSPTDVEGGYPGAEPRPGSTWRAVATCDYLGFMMRGSALREVGFLNPSFKYCWGAIHELSYHLYRAGWFVAYCDLVSYRHLGGTTYGAAGTNTISREEYQRRAARFAYAYFTRLYGSHWAEDFWQAARGHEIEIDTFGLHAERWSRAFRQDELSQLALLAPSGPPAVEAAAPPSPPAELPRLYLGSGQDKREGWINVDVNPDHAPDLVASAESLPTIADASVAAIEACHLFEHFTLSQARAALREWRRVLVPGGELALELPNLDACIRLIGTDLDGHDLGLASIFGYPPEVDAEGTPQLHKWGWTPQTLQAELEAAGFEEVSEAPVTQSWRKAASFDRDMRLVARAPRRTPGADPLPAPEAHGPAEGSAEDGLPDELRDVVSRLSATLKPEPRLTPPSPPLLSTAPPAPPVTDRKAVLAWPDYRDAPGLERFFHTFARVLSDRDDVVLAFRVDPELDPPSEAVLKALAAAHDRVLGPEAALEITLLDLPLDPAGWKELSPQIDVRIRSAGEGPPRDAVTMLTAPVVDDPAALVALLSGHGAPSTPAPQAKGVHIEPGASPPKDLLARIEALHPWFYPVEFEGVRVVPGIGSPCRPDWLENRARCRARLLRDAVLEQVDMTGRSVLDLASNCGYWSAHYARAGARRVVGIEGRARHVEQARLYWSQGSFLPDEAWEFFQGNVSDERHWQRIYINGPYDVTLCAGILSHVPDYAELLQRIALTTREVLILDTDVTDGPETSVHEPEDPSIDSSGEAPSKTVPNRERLMQALATLGFDVSVLAAPSSSGLDARDDDYAAGKRVTLIARKVRAPVSERVPKRIELTECAG